MQLDTYNKVYCLGIGGIGMSGLARWFIKKRMSVSGYDSTSTTLTTELIQEGIAISFQDAVSTIPNTYTKEATLVIYSPAISDDNRIFTYFRQHGFVVMKRSKVLGLIAEKHHTVAVAGTHGKTTTSALIAHILKHAKMNMAAFLGGVSINYATNLVIEEREDMPESLILIAEADEFDRSFLTLFPDIAIVTAVDADHLDIYGTAQNMMQSFADFIDQLKSDGTLIIHESVATKTDVKKHLTYGLRQGDFYADNICIEGHLFRFDLIGFEKVIKNIELHMPGFYNIENTIAAIIVAHRLGIGENTIRRAIGSFRGIKRRFEFVFAKKGVIYIDDYAHHPVEIRSFIASLRAMYSNKKITIIFQPHLYTRTRDFAEEFAKSLSMADAILLLDIYPAREKPILGITSDIIFRAITRDLKIRCTKQTLLQQLAKLDLEVLATVGAGDIDTCVQPIKTLLEQQHYAT